MIDYSVFMMGNPMDVDAAQKAYAKAQVSEIMPFSQFVKHNCRPQRRIHSRNGKGVIAICASACRDASGGQKSTNWQN